MLKKSEKIRKNQKKSEKIDKKLKKKKSGKIRKNNLKITNSTCIYNILSIFDESWKKKKEEDRKVLYKLLIKRAKNGTFSNQKFTF